MSGFIIINYIININTIFRFEESKINIPRASKQLLENINVEQEDTSLDFEEENDENEDNNSNSIHDKHQSKSRNTKVVNRNIFI
ncbi:hypothetical protein RhiirC2_777603 [Rhizophagus irregularis]|uniref:Uncharacterized protein n=1 Tax=Rhizophagus irregularis TaxID=588596 RepID=A0A2N1NDU6_9GLOM|nr:hypothetical protein RhiirC2_777603 [Rhizophagus irregularis]